MLTAARRALRKITTKKSKGRISFLQLVVFLHLPDTVGDIRQ